MDLAREAQNDAERYLLLQGAFKLYARGEDYDFAANHIRGVLSTSSISSPSVWRMLLSCRNCVR